MTAYLKCIKVNLLNHQKVSKAKTLSETTYAYKHRQGRKINFHVDTYMYAHSPLHINALDVVHLQNYLVHTQHSCSSNTTVCTKYSS